eukprot:gene9277-9442_t
MQVRQHLLPKRLRVIVLGAASAISGGTDTKALAAAAGGAGSSRAGRAGAGSNRAGGIAAAAGGGAADSVCPPAHELAWCYDVVITTFQRLSNDWSMRSDPRMAERLVLLKVHWLRVLVDEGHSLGASLSLTNKLAMALRLAAERRWVMTGTPTPATAAGEAAGTRARRVTLLDFAVAHAASYNALVEVIRRNLLMADWCDDSHYEVKTPTQGRADRCWGSDATLAGEGVGQRTVLAGTAVWINGSGGAEYAVSLLNARNTKWAKEMIFNVRQACCVAGSLDLVVKEEDLLETLQAVDDPARYKNNPHPKWQVPLDMIEWQPVFHQRGATGVSGGHWSADWRITKSTKVVHLIRRLIDIGIYTPSKAAAGAAPWQQLQHSLGLSVAGDDHQAGGILKHAGSSTGVGSRLMKAIVFSQFWMHLQLVAAELAARGVRHYLLKRDMPARDKQAAVTAFRASPSNCCLVMDESGALGLDLSFVRYIFLMEPMADASLEQQVVSRAHRMGAVAPVHVEVLAMRHTVEEHLVALSNITDFVTVGGGGNQLDSRALRNLVLLHLKKVAVADLAEELPVHDDQGPGPAAAPHQRNAHINVGFWGFAAVVADACPAADSADLPNCVSASAANQQVEGAAQAANRSASVWDVFQQKPGAIAGGATADVAADLYNRYRQDIALMRQLGLKHFRLSISWSRLLPGARQGSPVNPEAAGFYQALLTELQSSGIQPLVALYHWDLPHSLHDEYQGFLSARIIDDFAYFADTAFRLFGDKVRRWLTFIEPYVVCNMQYGNGQYAPGINYGDEGRYKCGHHVLMAHAKAAQLYRQKYQAAQRGQLSFSTLVTWPEPASSSPQDVRAAQNKLDAEVGWWLDPVYFGDYPATLKATKGSFLPSFTSQQRQLLNGSLDFIAANCFTAKWVSARPGSDLGWKESKTDSSGKLIGPATGVPWINLVPWSQGRMLKYLTQRYSSKAVQAIQAVQPARPAQVDQSNAATYRQPLQSSVGAGSTTTSSWKGQGAQQQLPATQQPAILISSSGVQVPGEDKQSLPGAVNDSARIEYYRSYLDSVCEAAADGVRVIGWYAWSFMDSFEWTDGYTRKFGLVHVAYDSPQVGSFLFCDWAGPPVRVLHWVPPASTSCNQILFVIHGVRRNADDYIKAWLPLAQANNFAVVAPHFSLEDFPTDAQYQLGNTEDPAGDRNPPSLWVYSVIEPLFDHLLQRHPNLNTSSYALYGHSAGAQFVHRFLLHVPEARCSLAMAANAGWYTMPNFTATWPYGLQGSALAAEYGDAWQQCLVKPLTLLLGDQDIDPNDKNLRNTPEAVAQGMLGTPNASLHN